MHRAAHDAAARGCRYFLGQVEIPNGTYSGQKPIAAVASGTMPIHAHQGPPASAHTIRATPTTTRTSDRRRPC